MRFDHNLLFWPILAILFGVPTLIFIPRQEYKKFFIFGFILGGVIDAVTIILGNLSGEFSYLAGPLMAFGIPIFVPLAFTFIWMMFFYFLPARMVFLIPYIIGFSGFAVLIGAVEQNLGYFKYHHGSIRGSLVTASVFSLWFSLSAWVYRRYSPNYLRQ